MGLLDEESSCVFSWRREDILVFIYIQKLPCLDFKCLGWDVCTLLSEIECKLSSLLSSLGKHEESKCGNIDDSILLLVGSIRLHSTNRSNR